MTIAHPLAWALLLLAVPIILFFLLKVRFQKESITTAMFWQQVIEERRNRRLRRNLRYIISLLLALLFLSLLTAAVLNPSFSETQNSRCVIIIDNSASMNSLLTGKTTRLDKAKQQAARRLDQIAAGQQVAILSASVNPQIISGFTDHAATLRRKLSEIHATDYPGDLPAARRLAEQLIADHPDSPIYVYSGGEPINNLAITRFQPRRLPEQVADYEIFVEVVNFGSETVETQLEIDCEGNFVDILSLTLEPRSPTSKIIRGTSVRGGLFTAALTDSDSFPADNTAIAFLSEQFVQRILLYGEENFFLWHVLQSLPMTEITVIKEVPESIPAESVLVLHQTVPRTLPSGDVLVIDPQNGCDLFQVRENVERPIAAKVESGHALVRFIQPGLVFAGAKEIAPRRNTFTALAETAEDFPLYMQFVSDHQRTLVLTADLNQGDLPLRTAFPILVSQALAYFRNSEELQRAYSTAEPVQLTLPTEKPQVVLHSPSGREEIFPCQEGTVSFGRLGECGVWTVLEPESQRELVRIACNLFNAAESDFHRGAESEREPSESDSATVFAYPIWYYLILFALFLTAAEWWLYQRRWIE